MSDEYYFISNSKVVVIYFWSKYRNLKKDFFKLFGGLNKNLERGAQAFVKLENNSMTMLKRHNELV